MNSGGYLPRRSGSVNIHRYSPPLRRIIVKYLWCQSGGWLKVSVRWHFQSREHFSKWCGSRLTVMHIQLPNWDLGLWDYLGFKSRSYCTQCYIGGEGEGLHNCCADGTSRIMKWNVNEGSNSYKTLLYEGDCDCRISSTFIWDSSNTKRFLCLFATTRDAWESTRKRKHQDQTRSKSPKRFMILTLLVHLDTVSFMHYLLLLPQLSICMQVDSSDILISQTAFIVQKWITTCIDWPWRNYLLQQNKQVNNSLLFCGICLIPGTRGAAS